MNIEFKTHTSGEDKFCRRCQSIGIKTPTIIKGHEYIDVVANGRPAYSMCLDCFERLREEAVET